MGTMRAREVITNRSTDCHLQLTKALDAMHAQRGIKIMKRYYLFNARARLEVMTVAATPTMNEGEHEATETKVANPIQCPSRYCQLVGRTQRQSSCRHKVN